MNARPGSSGPESAAPRIVGVKRVAEYVKRKLEGDTQLRRVSVRGEVTNYSVMRGNHVSFALKEADAVLRCFAYASDAAEFPPLHNGLAVVATGAVSVYLGGSVYQLNVREVAHEGVGNVHALFEERKARLTAEGMFAPERKRRLPPFPFRVALVSSRASDGARDFETVLRRRAPHVRVQWFETIVQGVGAGVEIADAVRRASAADVDCIVVTRGGGSFEDLFAFSDEPVVRAIASAKRPVISAIGHTADQQLCDFAADVHVETPTAAAEAIGPRTLDLEQRLADAMRRSRRCFDASSERLGRRLESALLRSRLEDPRAFLQPLVQRGLDLEDRVERKLRTALAARETHVRGLVRRLEARDPSRRLAERELRLTAARGRLDGASARAYERAGVHVRGVAERLQRGVATQHERRQRRLELLAARLAGNSPERLFHQGYAMITYAGAIVRDPTAVPLGALVEARVAWGTLDARVEAAHTERKEANEHGIG